MEIYIYKYENLLNGMVYIGQTTNVKRRSYEHKSAYGGVSKFHKDIRKYGYENFELTVLEVTDEEHGDEREMFYINLYDSNNPDKGYNQMTPGTSKHKVALSKTISESLRGKKASEEKRKHISESQPKIQIKVDGILFNSIVEAANTFGWDRRCLAYCSKRNKYGMYKGCRIERIEKND